MRKVRLTENEYYHIYNRGVDKRNVFLDDFCFYRFYTSLILLNDIQDGLMERYRDYQRTHPKAQPSEFLRLSLRKENPLVKIVAYCLNPNHYHFILEQKKENGIEKFMHRIGTSYTMYFNKKYQRSGALFQGRFKSAQIKPNGLLYLSAYVNCNSEIHGIAKAEKYRWCSFPDYIGKRRDNLCSKKTILGDFKSGKEYFEFAKENMKAQKQKKEDEKLYFE